MSKKVKMMTNVSTPLPRVMTRGRLFGKERRQEPDGEIVHKYMQNGVPMRSVITAKQFPSYSDGVDLLGLIALFLEYEKLNPVEIQILKNGDKLHRYGTQPTNMSQICAALKLPANQIYYKRCRELLRLFSSIEMTQEVLNRDGNVVDNRVSEIIHVPEGTNTKFSMLWNMDFVDWFRDDSEIYRYNLPKLREEKGSLKRGLLMMVMTQGFMLDPKHPANPRPGRGMSWASVLEFFALRPPVKQHGKRATQEDTELHKLNMKKYDNRVENFRDEVRKALTKLKAKKKIVSFEFRKAFGDLDLCIATHDRYIPIRDDSADEKKFLMYDKETGEKRSPKPRRTSPEKKSKSED